MLTLKPIPCREDNYIWILHNQSHAWVIDPSIAEPVQDYIAQHGLILADILLTHHHFDHIEGIPALIPHVTGKIIGTSNRILAINNRPKTDFTLSMSDIKVQLIHTPGHTYDHVSYWVKLPEQAPILFCGDTIFSAGCGRIFDGTIEQLFDSFQTLMNLPAHTIIACAHEYTLANLKFALAIDSAHEITQNHNNQVKYARELGKPSLPTTLAIEKQINPYMRCIAFEPSWIEQLRLFAHQHGESTSIESPFDAFRICRNLKNRF